MIAPAFTSTDQLSVSLVPSTTDWAFATVKPPNIKANKIIDFLSGISMEIYLCHMVMFRVVERLHLENYISDSNLNYVVTSVLTICLAICFAYCVQRGLDKLLLKKIA